MNINEIPTVSVEQALELMESGENVVMFDMRLEAEYDAAHAPDAVHFTPENFQEEAKHFAPDTKILCMCYRGNASKVLTRDLVEMGFDAYSVDGGITA